MISRWQVQWAEPALRTLYSLPWQQAARIDKAILQFAQSGEGDLIRLSGDHLSLIRLRASTQFVVMSADRSARTLTVWSIYRF